MRPPKSRSLFLVVGVTLAAACGIPTAPASAHPVPVAAVTRAVTAASVPPARDAKAAPSARSAARATTSYAKQTSVAVNRQRHRDGRRKLRSVSCLVDQARARATTMAQTRQLVHARLQPVLTACGLSRAGENIAAGFATGRSVVDDGWMLSAAHRRNLLARHFHTMGVAAVQDAGGTWYVALVLGQP